MQADKLRAGLLALPPNERAELAHVLLESLHDQEPEPGAEAAWRAELDRRAQAVADGPPCQ